MTQLPPFDPLTRAAELARKASCAINELLREEPAVEHGFARGHRVTIHPGHPYQYGQSWVIQPGQPLGDSGPAIAFGHVDHARTGCRSICRLLCPLITVNVEGQLEPDGAVRHKPVGQQRWRLDQVRHAD